MRARWVGLVVVASACLAYQWIMHALIADSATASSRFALILLNGVPHAVLNLFLLWAFGRTLLHGRESLITEFARRAHGTLPPDIEAYTRNTTVAWCVFFGLQVVVSAILLAVSPLDVWSLFVNVLSFPSIVCMFVAEYAYRILRFRDFSHVSIWRGIRLFLEHGRAVDEGRLPR